MGGILLQLIKLQLSLFKLHLLVVQFVTNIPKFFPDCGDFCLYLCGIAKMILHVIFKLGNGRLLLRFRLFQAAYHRLQCLDTCLGFRDAMVEGRKKNLLRFHILR